MEEININEQNKMDFISGLIANIKDNDGKIGFEFITKYADRAEHIYLQPTANMRLCVLKLETGHEVIGVAQVLDSKNDVESTGNKIAYNNAVNELWKTFGAIAKVL